MIANEICTLKNEEMAKLRTSFLEHMVIKNQIENLLEKPTQGMILVIQAGFHSQPYLYPTSFHLCGIKIEAKTWNI